MKSRVMNPTEPPKKERSRAYPLVDLQTAVEILRGQLLNLGTAPVDRKTLAKALGYSSGDGGIAARKIGALVQYGLLDRHAKLYRVSLLGRRLQGLVPGDPEYHLALWTALERPALFRQILRRFSLVGRLPENLAQVLVQDYGITARACTEAEAVLVRSAWFADVLDEDGRLRSGSLSPSQAQVSAVLSPPSPETGKTVELRLTGGKVARLELPPNMTREDLNWLEKRLRFDLKEGAFWAILNFEKPAAKALMKPAEDLGRSSESPSDSPSNLVPFANRPGNQAS